MDLRAVFFDLDGTLLDTADDLSAALNKILHEDGLQTLPMSITRSIVSEGSYALVKRGYGLVTGDPRIAPLRQRLLAHYLDNICDRTVAFDGIGTLIEKLAENDLRWGIITNKPRRYTEALMQHFTFASTPSCVLSPEHVSKPKPDPESLFLACQQTNCHVNEAIYIGDHRRDIDCGKNAGMPTVAVSYGYIPEGENIRSWEADHSVDTADAIWPIIQTYLNA